MGREAATIAPAARGDVTRIAAFGALAVYAGLLAFALLFWQTAGARDFLSSGALLTSSGLAAGACLAAGRALRAPARVPWFFFGGSALAATLAHFGVLATDRSIALLITHISWLTSYALFFAAIVTAVHQGKRESVLELLLDVALIVTAATAVLLRWAPGIRAAPPESPLTLVLVVLEPVVALCAVLFTVVLLKDPPATLTSSTRVLITAAVLCLAVTAAPHVLSSSGCCHTNPTTALAAIGVWLFLTSAGATALGNGSDTVVSADADRLRQFVAPTVAIVLATVSIDAALRPPIGRGTALALGVLGALVAVRLIELLNATRSQLQERRELAQTRALVEVSRALAGATEIDATLRVVAYWATRVLSARAASVEMISADGQLLVTRAVEGFPAQMLGLSFPIEASYTGWVVKTGARVTVSARNDPLVSPQALPYLGDSAVAAVPLRYRDRTLGVLSCVRDTPFESAELELLRAFADQAAIALEDARLFEQVRALSITDPLTGLPNRRQLDRELDREFAAARRGRRLMLVMFDLDDFKQHNDKYGHVAGDEALKLFAAALSASTRAMNMAARYAGDEFVALLTDTDEPGARVFISRVQEKFSRAMRAARKQPITVSAGIAAYNEEMRSPSELIDAADRALYLVKSSST